MNDGHVGVVFSQGNAHWAARSIGTFQVSPGLSVEPGLSQPRASALEDKLNQLSRAHNPRGLPDLGKCRRFPVTRKSAPAASAHSRKRLSVSSGDTARVVAGAIIVLIFRMRIRDSAILSGGNRNLGLRRTHSYSMRIGAETRRRRCWWRTRL